MDFQKIYQYSKNLTVLYVEDDDALRNATLEAVEDYFLRVDVAENGQIALNKYNNYHQKKGLYYDLIITDIKMPVMDGLNFIKEIDKICSDQTVIVVSAYNESDRLTDLINIGISHFLMKPIAFDKLKNTLYQSCRNISNHKEVIEQRKELENINKNLDAKVKVLAKEILFVQKISIETIANMVESYDDETGTHIKRIEGYTSLLLDEVPVSDDCPQELRLTVPFASLLHDIGKLMIPKEILTKKGQLDRDEFEIIKTHAKLGGEVLKKANITFRDSFNKDSYLKIASEIAMYHHEKWDGSGYPEGLKEKNIPKCARIVAIADVYDALRSKRVYKDAFSHEKAVSIIKSERKKSFDPELVDIFLGLNQEFNEVFTRLS